MVQFRVVFLNFMCAPVFVMSHIQSLTSQYIRRIFIDVTVVTDLDYEQFLFPLRNIQVVGKTKFPFGAKTRCERIGR